MIDMGSVANILDESLYDRLGRPRLSPCKACLRPYGERKPLKVLGSCHLVVETKRRIQAHRFHVVSGSYGALLGFDAATELDLVTVNLNSVQADKSERLKTEFPDLYRGIGKLKNAQVKLHIDTSVRPVAQRHRRTPFHLRDKVETELNKLLREDIIEKVEGEPTPWVSPIVYSST